MGFSIHFKFLFLLNYSIEKFIRLVSGEMMSDNY